jgi:uncharacterized phage protein (TIGR02220 family)
MSGDWIKIEFSTPDKPEVHGIARVLDMDPDLVFAKLIRIWIWFDMHTTNGNAHSVTENVIDRVSGVTGFGTAMKEVGWLFIDSDGIGIPNFDNHMSESSKKRALTAKRVSNFRKRSRNANRNGDSVTDALPEKRREEINKPPPNTPPVGDRKKRKNSMTEFREAAIRILEFLNAKTGRRYRPGDVNLRFIASRMREGATETECRQVIAKKVREWQSSEDRAQYLRPATLFNATKFAQYIGELGARNPEDKNA